MKICHITSAHLRDDTRIFLKECTSLAKNGFETYLVVADGADDEIINGVYIKGVPRAKGSRLARMTKTVWQVFKRAKGINASIYHFHDPELIFVALFLKSRGHKVIYDVHEDLPKQIMAKPWIKPIFRRLIAFVMRTIEDFASRRFDAVCCATPAITERYLRTNNRATTINNFPILNELNSSVSWSGKENQLCYVGGITEIRGIQQVIDAMGKVSATLNLAGEIVGTDLSNSLRAKSGWNNVNELGQIGRESVKAVLAKSRLGIVTFLPLPNHIDAQPNKLFEYMSAGIPVVASHFPLWRDIVEKYDCGICVDPENSDELATALNYLLNNPKEAEQKGKNGREAVENVFNWEQQSIALIDLYKDLEN